MSRQGWLGVALSGLLIACGGDGNTPFASGDAGSGAESASGGSAGDGAGGAAGGAGGSGATTSDGGGPDQPGYVIDESAVSWHNPDLKAMVHFAPLDDMEGHVLAELGKAQTSIDLAFFNVRLEQVRDLLVAKHNAGVAVRVVLDDRQQQQSYNTMGEELAALGVPVTLVLNDSAENATMHNKVAIVDGHLVMTGSANYSFTALQVSDEDLLTFDDAALAARYQQEIDEIIAAGDAPSAPYAQHSPLEVWMGPEDGLANKVVALLDAAQSTAVVAMFQLNVSVIVDALLDAHQRGVSVVVVLDAVQATQVDADADETLAAAGIPVVLAHNTGNMVAEMHSKFVVVDHDTVLMGSYNWTNLGSYYNDENIVVIDDPELAARFEGRVADLFHSYNAPSAAAMGLTSGPQQVVFEVGNVSFDPGVSLYLVTDQSGPYPTGIALDGDSLTATIQAGQALSYHYELRHNGTTLLSESDGHRFTVPYAPGPFAVRDAFVP